jgi:hypothetical protein
LTAGETSAFATTGLDASPDGCTLNRIMTAKEQLRERVEALSEEQAAEYLRVFDQRSDPMIAFLDDAPADDEPLTPDEEAAIREAEEDIARGDTINLKELKAELGL